MDPHSFSFMNGHSSSSLKKFHSNSLHNFIDGVEVGNEEGVLEFESAQFSSNILESLANLRQQNQFCDAILRVGEKEVTIHRAVLAACSPFFFELFERSSDTHCYEMESQRVPMYKLKDVCFTAFSRLLDYMYSGRLVVPLKDVVEVYRTATLLRMEQATQACSAFLAEHLTPTSCLAIRMFADDVSFRRHIDDFIQDNVEYVMNSKAFFSLPELQVEIVGADDCLHNEANSRQLFQLVVKWALDSLQKLSSSASVEILTEEVNILYLNYDNRLQDCKDVDDTRMSDDEVIMDYKTHSKRRTKQRHSPSSPDLPAHTFNSDDGLIEEEFSVIATMQQKEGSYMGLAVISGTLVAMSLHLRQVALSADTSLINGDLMPTAEPRERSMTMQLLQTMGSSRCAFGACIWDDCIIVCGGYNRGECLASMEIYEPCQGQWLDMPDMLTARARFGAALLNTFLYTIGGCDGITDLDSVHRFDFSCKTWDVVASLQTARSSVGVAELDGSLYCVGGSDGQLSLKSCEVYSCKLDTWNFVSPLLIGRSQVSVVACKGSLLAVGGLDSWNCLSSVEMYSPVTDTWTMVAALSTVRRGAGVDVVGDDVWVVGGSNGSASLRTSEIFSFHANSWRPGPSLSVPRANMSAVFFNDKLYAIGGFSGKKFLNTLEILSFPSQEWSSYQPAISTHPDGSFFGAEHKPIPTPDTCNLALLVQQ